MPPSGSHSSPVLVLENRCFIFFFLFLIFFFLIPFNSNNEVIKGGKVREEEEMGKMQKKSPLGEYLHVLYDMHIHAIHFT